jgi:hypothetical protein
MTRRLLHTTRNTEKELALGGNIIEDSDLVLYHIILKHYLATGENGGKPALYTANLQLARTYPDREYARWAKSTLRDKKHLIVVTVEEAKKGLLL